MRRSEAIVLACRNAYRAIGFEYLRDRDMLRPGEMWDQALLQYIDIGKLMPLVPLQGLTPNGGGGTR